MRFGERGWGVRPENLGSLAPPMTPKQERDNEFARMHFRTYVSLRSALGPGCGPSIEEVNEYA